MGNTQSERLITDILYRLIFASKKPFDFKQARTGGGGTFRVKGQIEGNKSGVPGHFAERQFAKNRHFAENGEMFGTFSTMQFSTTVYKITIIWSLAVHNGPLAVNNHTDYWWLVCA